MSDKPLIPLLPQMAVLQFGVNIDEARAHATDVARRMERAERKRKRRSRLTGARK